MTNKALEKNIDLMKKIIAEKNAKSSCTKETSRPIKSIGEVRKAKRSNNGGGLFDK
ncbi:MAG: hypothetical protein RSB70_03315 [Clostridium sp.]